MTEDTRYQIVIVATGAFFDIDVLDDGSAILSSAKGSLRLPTSEVDDIIREWRSVDDEEAAETADEALRGDFDCIEKILRLDVRSILDRA